MTEGNEAGTAPALRVYGAEWCGDCRRTKRQLEGLAVGFDYVDLEADPAAADEARRISGRTNIPVVVYPDGSHQVEPSNAEVEAKLRELSLLDA
ncbi:glutaredoxin domain-containing protein [Glycomyces luteolus]|uniref:Glutaredoxin domain-containing protein n=1 Tax=Glycomyces luteolus TaxID=2670330 RepID=A0A9X3PCL4_9ACTN|nr:glutaredoxin domain-containing protein [Glycomyces luteolus]MDA1361020.1 glutaredoxin domain-containing protein [Glycomyces luteolus]